MKKTICDKTICDECGKELPTGPTNIDSALYYIAHMQAKHGVKDEEIGVSFG